MIDAYLYAGIRPSKFAKEPSFFDMSVPSAMFEGIKNNNVRQPASGIFTPVSKTPSILTDVVFRSTMKSALYAKGQPEAITYGRVESDKNAYMYPSQGYARDQPKGLATNMRQPMKGAIMPIAGFFNPNELNIFGN